MTHYQVEVFSVLVDQAMDLEMNLLRGVISGLRLHQRLLVLDSTMKLALSEPLLHASLSSGCDLGLSLKLPSASGGPDYGSLPMFHFDAPRSSGGDLGHTLAPSGGQDRGYASSNEMSHPHGSCSHQRLPVLVVQMNHHQCCILMHLVPAEDHHLLMVVVDRMVLAFSF
ncbi:uncharacterized protein LOC113331473 isoform X2 [Papaver somniferum]|uniref:uncharacterized protein LOC113331473 isoform X2 n=1 Tax=Papaver somniferum TaxID=3469 RepID=UPI000E6F599D|nr:uncharacterized protein LOC113331473 isoform X2 [Papaver somniferum]